MIYKDFNEFWKSFKTERAERMVGKELAQAVFEELMIGYKPRNEKLLSYAEWMKKKEAEELKQKGIIEFKFDDSEYIK